MVTSLRSYVRRHHVALIALFVALGGTAWAAATIGPNDIRDNAVRARHIKNGQVRTADLDRGAVLPGNIDAADCATVAAEESTTSVGQSSDLTTPGPTVRVAIPPSGVVMAYAEADIKSAMAGKAVDISLAGFKTAKPGFNFVDSVFLSTQADSFDHRVTPANAANPFGGAFQVLGSDLFAGSTGAWRFSLKYHVEDVGNTGTFRNRKLCVMAIG